ncbi:DUF1189 domain-containing protein [Caldibacillus lycopersici]|uniref:DUF1189 domain-containing protein n=1 Tax=Perspicuibacillus lycopersici TaxID=1325689 RepID=A0AAE3LTE7_9BACI|nr:DUF1189 domain-containing protein [Perspicuibacillus lycopersici]MCU9613888.1 DUF1189 domain-containing protein [Perspicuibacillus lycopersici]
MNIFKQFYKSLYSPKDMVNFRNQKMGKTIGYLFFLSLIATLPIFIITATIISNGIDRVENTLMNDLPEFEIQDGTLVSNSNEPIHVQKDDFSIIFDSTGTITVNDALNEANTLSILKNDVAINLEGQTDSFTYSFLELDSLTKDQLADIVQSVDSFIPVINIVIFILFYLFQAASSFIKVTILALIGLIIKNSLKETLTYGQSWKLSAYAITLPTLFFTIMEALQVTVPLGGMINWAVMVIMLFLVIKEIPKQSDLS